MNKNKVLIVGMISLKKDLKFIHEMDSNEIFTTDGISYTLLLQNSDKKVSDVLLDDLKQKECLYEKSIFLNDREKVEMMENDIGFTKKDILAKVLQYFCSFNVIELIRIKDFLSKENTKDLILITNINYLKLLNQILDTSIFKRIIIRECNISDQLKYFLKSSLISHFGRLNFLRYSIGFTMFSLCKSKIKSRVNDCLVVSENSYALNIAKKLFPEYSFSSLDDIWKVNFTFFLKHYFKAFKETSRQIETNKGFYFILKLTPFLYKSVKFLYGPYLMTIRYKLTKELSSKKIRYIIQHSDASPHRRIIAYEANNINIKTIVTNHGYLAEPLMITDIKSQLLCTSSKGYSYYAKDNPHSEHLELKNVKNDYKNFSKKKKEFHINKYIYILTNGYTGNSLRNSLQENFELINEVIKKSKELNAENNLIIKIHPSESKKLYSEFFKDIKISDEGLDQILHKVNRVISTTTSALFYLRSECKVCYFSFGQRPYQYPTNKRLFSIEEIIKDSLNI